MLKKGKNEIDVKTSLGEMGRALEALEMKVIRTAEILENAEPRKFMNVIDKIIEDFSRTYNEIKSEIGIMKKIHDDIELRANRIEQIESDIQDKLSEINRRTEMLENNSILAGEIAKDVDFIKKKLLTFAQKDDVDKVADKTKKYVEALKDIGKKSSLSQNIESLKAVLEKLDD